MSFDFRESSRYGGQPIKCYRFSQGSTLWFYTSADRTVTITPGTFTPEAIEEDEQTFNEEEGAGNLTLRIPRTNPVAQLFIASGLPPTPTHVTVYHAHRGDTDVVSPFTGVVGGVDYEGTSQVALVCTAVERAFRRSLPILTFQNPCNWALYGPNCTVSKAAFRDVVTVTAVGTSTVAAAEFALRADNWFTGGYLEDPVSGDVRFIVNHVGSTVTLMNPFRSLAVATSLNAYAGCDRSEATCASKFSNLVNHLGFARVPQRNPYGGSVV